MSTLFFLTSVSFFLWALRNLLFWTYLWQLKEYRLDRVFAHLKETYQGKLLIFSPRLLLKWIAFFSFVYIIFHEDYLFVYQVFVAIVFLIEALFVVKEILTRQIRRPVLTAKAVFILSLASLVLFTFYSFPLLEQFVWLLIIDRLIPVIVICIVFALSVPTRLYRDMQVDKAIFRMKEYKNQSAQTKGLLVIGVTGSYGKSSTKEFTAQILEKKFRVVKTQGTNNTLIGVVGTVLSKVKKSTEIFVVEAGAYKRGEIKEICDVISPDIGILTAVNDQHLSLFGSLENTMKAKYELIESLPKTGFALINGNNENSYKLYMSTKKRKVLYQCLKSSRDLSAALRMVKGYVSSSIFAFNIVSSKTAVMFDVYVKSNTLHLVAPLIGAQAIENMLPGIYIASNLGMTFLEIKKAVSTIIPLPKTMVRYELKNGLTVVDDTFNANPNSVLAAIEYMKLYKKSKILVLHPLLELGGNAKEEHYRLGKEIASVCDTLIVTNKNFYKEMQKGASEVNPRCLVKICKVDEVLELVRSLGKEDVMVFEGKEAGFLLDNIL